MTKKLRLILLLLIIVPRLYAQVPVAAFSASTISGCTPIGVSFTDQSTGNPKFWNWDFGNGQLSNQQNPVAVYTTPGTYSVTLIVRNADGTNGLTKTNYITVYPSPSAGLSANITTGCLPSNIQFTDNSVANSGTITSWQWDFGDGSTSTAQHPSHQYTSVGFYTVGLTVKSSTGCEGSTAQIRYIRIVAGVIPDFEFTNPGICRGPFNVPFSNQTSGPGNITYQWDFGNSTSSANENPVGVFNTAGTYNVTLNALSEYGCAGSITKPVNITGTSTAITSPDTVCIGSTVSFQNNSNPAAVSATWNFGNGAQSIRINDTSTYPSAGNYIIKLVNVYDNCTDSVSKTLVVLDKPVVNFTAPVTTGCKAPLTVNFADASANAASWLWNFGDGGSSTLRNPSHTYTAEGSYDVTLTITTRQGCTNTLTLSAFVRIIKPTVSFANAPTGGCIPFSFTPQATVDAIDGAASFTWEYGDGFTATTNPPFANPPLGPSHVYAATGSYDIKVTMTTIGGCSAESSLSRGVRTGTPPVANFSVAPTDACASMGINFTDLSTPVPAPPALGVDEWLWSFGDNTTSTEKNPTHLYADSGTFSATVTAYINRCPTTSAAQLIHIKPPIASYIYAVDCANGRTVNFTNQSRIDLVNYGPASYSWDFGDGSPVNTSAGPAVQHTFPAKQAYTVSLTVTEGGCSHTFTQTVELVGDVADFSVSDATLCKNQPVTFTATNSIPAHIATYEWAIDGGALFTGAIALDTSFSAIGAHNITLQITDLNGCKDIKTINAAVVVTGPTANFAPATKGGCSNNAITFNDLSVAAAGIKSLTFDFGDGNISTFTSAPYTHTYTSRGIYIVKLTATDNNSCSDTYTSTDTLKITRPGVGFKTDHTIICPNTDLTFKDTSSGEGLHYVWDFGDGNFSTDEKPVHQYTANTGTFTVKLVITDTAGCKDSVIKSNYITLMKPTAAFDVRDTSSICLLLESKFTFRGKDYESFSWEFGDGTTSTLQNPNHFYNDYGTYEAKLYVVGFGGCIDSASHFINVYNPANYTTLNYSPLSACNSILVDFDITVPDATSFIFSFGDGAKDSSQALSFQHLYNQPNFYAPSILIKDNMGCQATIGGSTTITVLGAVPYFNADKKAFCDSGTVFFTDYTFPPSEPIASRSWDFGDGGTSTDKDPIHKYTSPGTYLATQTTTTVANNCTNSITDTIRVYATPEPFIVSDSFACINNVFQLEGNLVYPDTSVTWSWDLGSNGSSTLPNPTVKYPATGNYTVSVVATNKLGCKGDSTKSLYVPPAPQVMIDGIPTIAVGTSVTIPATYSENIATYTWTPATALSCSDCPNPVASPKFSTLYNVAVQDIYGCSASKDIQITVICNAQNYFVPNTFSPNNDGQNDVFMPRGSSIARVNRMQIFNRWGELVYEKRNFMANDASAGWNGTYKGKPAKADVYIYLVEFVCENASVVPFRGNVTLLR